MNGHRKFLFLHLPAFVETLKSYRHINIRENTQQALHIQNNNQLSPFPQESLSAPILPQEYLPIHKKERSKKIEDLYILLNDREILLHIAEQDNITKRHDISP